MHKKNCLKGVAQKGGFRACPNCLELIGFSLNKHSIDIFGTSRGEVLLGAQMS